jgi:hypothetical protein
VVIIPNAENAFIDIRKLRDYALNPHHQVGKHKARLFAALLGMEMADAEELHDLLLQVVKTHEAEIEEKDDHGQRYRIACVLTWRGRQATIRSVWNVRPNEDFPPLVTCYPI